MEALSVFVQGLYKVFYDEIKQIIEECTFYTNQIPSLSCSITQQFKRHLIPTTYPSTYPTDLTYDYGT